MRLVLTVLIAANAVCFGWALAGHDWAHVALNGAVVIALCFARAVSR